MNALMIWVCESCGDSWNLARGVKPDLDIDGRPLCVGCRVYAGLPRVTHAEDVAVAGGVL